VGQVQLSPDNTFTITEWVYSNGTAQKLTSGGTYSVGPDCRLQLTFTPNSSNNGGTTGSVSFSAPTTFQLNNQANAQNNIAGQGFLVIQPMNVTTVVGTFIQQ
jgi:hypothetical protein